MHKMVFINLPVADLPRSKAFYQALGFEVVPAYTNDQAACLKISDAIFAMLLVRPFFQTFTDKTIVDPATHVQVLSCLSCDSPAEVDEVVAKARAAGGTYEDTEGLINLPLTVKEIQSVVFFKQTEGDEYRVSMRSKGEIDIGAVAKEFGGGGHKNAAGCTVTGPIDALQKVFLEKIEQAIDGRPAHR